MPRGFPNRQLPVRGGHPGRSRQISGVLKQPDSLRHTTCLVRMAGSQDGDTVRETAPNQLDAIVSTLYVDRGEDIILPSAYAKRLDFWKRNPVHLWAHDQSKVHNILGHGVPDSILILEQGFQVVFDYDVPLKFAQAAIDEDYSLSVDCLTPSQLHSLDALRKYRRGDLNAFSVGVDPFAWTTPDKLDAATIALLEKYGIDPSAAGTIYTDVEMWEISACGVPMNRESLVVGRSAGLLWNGVDLADLAEALNIEEAKTMATGALKKAHPLGQDVVARLHAVASNLDTCDWYWDCGPARDSNSPPAPEICAGSIPILEAILKDLQALAGQAAAATAAGPLVSPGPTPVLPVIPNASSTVLKSGAVASASTKTRIHNINACLNMAATHMGGLMKAAGMDPTDTPAVPSDVDPETDTNDATNDPENPGEQKFVLAD